MDLVRTMFEGSPVRALDRDGAPWFILVDVCRVLGIQNPSQYTEILRDTEKDLVVVDTAGGPQRLIAVSEGALFTVMFRSREAIRPGTLPYRFRCWVADELLPMLRKRMTALPPYDPFSPRGCVGTYEGVNGELEPNAIMEPLEDPQREAQARIQARKMDTDVSLIRPLVQRVAERELREAQGVKQERLT